MSEYKRPADVVVSFAALERRVNALENASNIRRYSTAQRPAASVSQGLIIFNTTTLKHEGSDGTSWNALY